MNDWFERLTGFKEISPEQVRANIHLDGGDTVLTSLVNGRKFVCGVFSVCSLDELRKVASVAKLDTSQTRIDEVVADVRDLHSDPSCSGALFQVASQFNLLEMEHYDVTPERGVGIYGNDNTQGPACAIAAGAGTIYRNYFVNINGRPGQTSDNQIDCLDRVGLMLGNRDDRLWSMKNGYVLATESGLDEITETILSSSLDKRNAIKGAIRFGLQRYTQVTILGANHRVSQIFCSALPVGYSPHSCEKWHEFSKIILEAAYEATLCAAIGNANITGNNKLYLTLLGDGVFRNDKYLVIDAMERAICMYGHGLDISVVSYSNSRHYVAGMIKRLTNTL